MSVRALADKTKRKVVGQGKIENRIGPSPDGPRLCLHCHKPFSPGEAWRRVTSPSDPEYGTYTVGIHQKCQGKKPGAD